MKKWQMIIRWQEVIYVNKFIDDMILVLSLINLYMPWYNEKDKEVNRYLNKIIWNDKEVNDD